MKCTYCGICNNLVLCTTCNKHFCNSRSQSSISHIIFHLVKSKHKTIKINEKDIHCMKCNEENIFKITKIGDNFFCKECTDQGECILEERCLTIIDIPNIENNKLMTKQQMSLIEEKSNYKLPTVKSKFKADEYLKIFNTLIDAECKKEKEIKESMKQVNVIVRWENMKFGYFYFYRTDADLKINIGDEIKLTHKSGLVITGFINNECFTEELKFEVDQPGEYPRSGYTIEYIWRGVSYERMKWAITKLYNLNLKKTEEFSIFDYLLRGTNEYMNNNVDIEMPPNLPRLNKYQEIAVKAALSRKVTLVQGPPGTGKTLVSAAIVYNYIKKVKGKVLVVAPSNTAVDQLTLKIHKTGLKVLRVMSRRREYTQSDVNFLSLHENLKELQGKRIVEENDMMYDNMRNDSSRNEYGRSDNMMYDHGRSDNMRSDSSRNEYGRNDNTRSDHGRNDNMRNEYGRNDNTRSDHGRSDNMRNEYGRNDNTRSDHGRSDNMRNDNNNTINMRNDHNINSMRNEQEDDYLKRQLLQQADVITCTCVTAGQKMFNRMKFACVVIDEAVQATEPLSIIPLVYGCTKLVLVGDHKQLGPTILSKKVAKAGFKQSLFERMIAVGVHPYKLSLQYRMHSDLCEWPSETFYNGELQTGNRLFHKINIGIPHNFFYSCYGKEEVSASGTSFVNTMEALYCENIIRHLFKSGVTESQIGVITPYEGQRSHILNRIFGSEPGNLEISNVDGFQGREKDYIIVSLVRSNQYQGIGFVGDKRRMNVALTRAKHGLIIIGNPSTLVKNEIWRSLLEYYDKNGLVLEGPLCDLKKTVIHKSTKVFDLRSIAECMDM